KGAESAVRGIELLHLRTLARQRVELENEVTLFDDVVEALADLLDVRLDGRVPRHGGVAVGPEDSQFSHRYLRTRSSGFNTATGKRESPGPEAVAAWRGLSDDARPGGKSWR